MLATPMAAKPSAEPSATNSRFTSSGSMRRVSVISLTNAAQYNHRMALPIALYSTAQVRALDAHAINELGVPGYTLMKRAGEAALRYLRTRWPMAHRIVIVCGGGNNGGDGYVLARFAHAAGLTVAVLAAIPPDELRGDARLAYDDFKSTGGQVHPVTPALFSEGDVVVDALLGTGLRGSVREDL